MSPEWGRSRTWKSRISSSLLRRPALPAPTPTPSCPPNACSFVLLSRQWPRGLLTRQQGVGTLGGGPGSSELGAAMVGLPGPLPVPVQARLPALRGCTSRGAWAFGPGGRPEGTGWDSESLSPGNVPCGHVRFSGENPQILSSIRKRSVSPEG